MKTKMSYAMQVKQRRLEAELLITKMLGVTTKEVAELIWLFGNAYAEKYLGGDELGVSLLTQSGSFWLWYKNQWSIVDERFISLKTSLFDDERLVLCGNEGVAEPINAGFYLKREWMELHHPDAMELIPGQDVWKEVENLIKVKRKEKDHA